MTISKGERMILEKDLAGLRQQKAAAMYHLAKGGLSPSLEQALVERQPYLDSAIERLTTRLASGRVLDGFLIEGFSELPQFTDRDHDAARDREFSLR